MSKQIDTLVEDIYDVLTNDTDHRLADVDSVSYGAALIEHMQRSLDGEEFRPMDKDKVWASMLGNNCMRQLWYKYNTPNPETLGGDVKYKFLYGNMIEETTLAIAKAAGHAVRHEQRRYEVTYTYNWDGKIRAVTVSGRIDAIIDNVIVDVKSASGFSYKKYTEQGLTDTTDTFGYRAQLDFYRQAHLLETGEALDTAFLFVDKQLGKHAIVPVANTTDIKGRAIDIHQVVNGEEEDAERIADFEQPDGKSGNMKLCTKCSYCDYKKACHPSVRGFAYSNKPVYLTKVVKEPRVPEFEVE